MSTRLKAVFNANQGSESLLSGGRVNGASRDKLSGAFSAGACLAAVAILLGCTVCTPSNSGIPQGYIWAGGILTALAAVLYLAPRTFDFAKVRSIPIGLNLAVFSGIVLAALHAGVLGVSFCPLCLTFWACLGISAYLQKGSFRLVVPFVTVVLLTVISIRVILGGESETARIDRTLARIFLGNIGFEYGGQVTIPSGYQFRSASINTLTGKVLFLTKCGQCTERAASQSLKKAGLTADEVLLVAGDDSAEWRTPEGFGSSRKILSTEAWKETGIKVYGPPVLVILRAGRVQEGVL